MLTFILIASYILIGICLFEWARRAAPELNPPIIAGICVAWPALIAAALVAIPLELLFDKDEE